MAQINYLTAEGYKKLKEELDYMRSVERPAAAAAIAEARDKGDLSENAEYDAAREAQGLLEMRIAQLEATLSGKIVNLCHNFISIFCFNLFSNHKKIKNFNPSEIETLMF